MTDLQRAQRLREIREEALKPFRADPALRAQYADNEEWYLAAQAALASGRARVFGTGARLRTSLSQWRAANATNLPR